MEWPAGCRPFSRTDFCLERLCSRGSIRNPTGGRSADYVALAGVLNGVLLICDGPSRRHRGLIGRIVLVQADALPRVGRGRSTAEFEFALDQAPDSDMTFARQKRMSQKS
jgi:hypothetical protein